MTLGALVILRLLLHLLSQLRLSDLLQRFLSGERRFSHIVPKSISHHIQVALGSVLPQEVGVANCG